MNDRATAWCLVVGLLMVAGAAAAQPMGDPMQQRMGSPMEQRMGSPMGVPMGRWWEWPRVAQQLGLSAEQTQKLEANTLSQATAMVDLKASVEKAEINLHAAADGQPFDAKRVREAFGVLQQARMKLEAQRFEMLLKTREVLTTDQWQKLRELARERRMERGKGGPGAGGSQPRGPRAWQE
ncbi:MAG: Spy/CpxP family protein refolding chaperone [Myxococcaceae bacterium]